MRPPSASDALIDPASAERFRADLACVFSEGFRPDKPLALAVSGGPDSIAMLLLAHAAVPGQIAVATVDHGLRPEAEDEALLVAGVCRHLGVPHATLCADAPLAGGNLQAEARALRYALLGGWALGIGARALATAHHADDQAETFLMRASRGSGVAGLAGVRSRRQDGAITLIRPLLAWRREELAAVVMQAGVATVTDPSNQDDRFDRTRMRRLLADTPALDAAGIARSAYHLAEAEADLRATTDWFWADRRRPSLDGEVLLAVADLPRTVQRSLVHRAIAAVRPPGTAATIEAMLDALIAGRAANQAGVLASVEHGAWRFRDEPPRRGE